MTVKRHLTLCAALALSACATQPKYIVKSCIPEGVVIPAEPKRIGDQLTGQADRDVQIIAGSAARLRSWGLALNGIVAACKG